MVWRLKTTDFQKDQFTITWLARALRNDNEPVDDWDRFISLWICFNSILKKEFGEMLQDTQLKAKSQEANSPFQPIFNNHWETAIFRTYFSELKKYPINNMKDPTNGTLVKNIQNDTWNDLIEAIYQIRCNLFHGRKGPSDIDPTDAILVKLAYKLLLPIIKQYVENKGLTKVIEERTNTGRRSY